MNPGLSSKTLAQLVNENHKAANIFEKYDLDFCCKGRRSLQVACEQQGLSVEMLTSELGDVFNRNESPIVDFDKLSLSELADYIVSTHHSYTKKELPQIFAYLQRVSSKHGDRHDELYTIFEKFAKLKNEMEMHMHKEELILFPRIKELESRVQNHEQGLNIQIPIMVMEDEHQHAGNLFKAIRELSNDYNPSADACTTYRLSFAALQALEIDLHQHIHLENNILFPKAMALFNPETSRSQL
jgi:regulator of cell morphogenesis and NO signaling